MKSFYLFLFLLTISSLRAQDCTDDQRYIDPIFEESDIEIEEIPFAHFAPSDLWNNGDTSSDCFKPTEYLELNQDGTFTMSMNIYYPSSTVDICTNRIAILFMHGGGYAHNSGNKDGDIPQAIAMEAAKRGFVAVTMDYRKGWDIKEAIFPISTGSQNCPCDGDCDQFSFMLATYKMAQDVKTAHHKMILEANNFGFDPSQIHYWGASTGAVGVVHAAYGGFAFEDYTNDDGDSLKNLAGDLDAFIDDPIPSWPIKPAGAHLLAGAIRDYSFIEDEHIPIILTHGTIDQVVHYCSGTILDMIYNNPGSLYKHLIVYGAGKMYYQFLNLNSNTTIAHLYSYNGLYHDFTNVFENGELDNNCNQRTELTDFLSPAFSFCKDILNEVPMQNEHHRFTNASFNNQDCISIRQDTSTQCQPIVISTNELASNDKNTFSVFPTPSSGMVTIQEIGEIDSKVIEVWDKLGRLILSQKTPSFNTDFQLDLSSFPDGMYFIKWGRQAKKILVLH